jgi:hypothetical protein
MAIAIESTIAFPLMGERSSRRSGSRQPVVAANVLALPLNDVEIMLCEKLHCSHKGYLASKARMRAGKTPLSDTGLGKIDSALAGPRAASGGGFRQV